MRSFSCMRGGLRGGFCVGREYSALKSHVEVRSVLQGGETFRCRIGRVTNMNTTRKAQRIRCPHCGYADDAPPEYAGQTGICDRCGGEFIIPYPAPTEDEGGCLCFFLGGFGPIGILIAALIGKKKGVIAALWGFLVVMLVVGVLYGVLFVLLGMSR